MGNLTVWVDRGLEATRAWQDQPTGLLKLRESSCNAKYSTSSTWQCQSIPPMTFVENKPWVGRVVFQLGSQVMHV